ncbi:hypothetical protein [Endozoicomonas sp. ALD040]|uniref:hypothetical protein n=1 Tax=unclassified Endozoicomonas TaxID=2644528 RepID=UPI003BAE54A6
MPGFLAFLGYLTVTWPFISMGSSHSGHQTCKVIILGKDSQPRPCGIVCKNVRALLCHKSKYHTGQQTCDVTLVREDGQPQQCGKVCKNAITLSRHKKTHQKRKPVDTNQKDGLSPP